MTLPWHPIRWLQRTVNAWLFGYLLSSLPAAEWVWEHPAIPQLPAPPGIAAMVTHAFGTWLPPQSAMIAVFVVMALALRGIVFPARWYLTLIQWVLFSSLVNFAWLTSTGGHQLMVNVLFWMILLPAKEPDPNTRSGMKDVLNLGAFWIIRLQLLAAYAVTGIQKLTGSHWLAGDAMGIVATDTAYGPAWLSSVPALAVIMNYAVLLFQLTFPMAVWWERTRGWWMLMGIVFHLSTGIAFGILDMGLAFLAVYPIWSRRGEGAAPAPVSA